MARVLLRIPIIMDKMDMVRITCREDRMKGMKRQ